MSGLPGLLDDARSAYDHNDWTVARSALLEADAEQPLEPDDLERLAWSCRWLSDESGFLNSLERAEVAFVDAHQRAAAARMALEQARYHKQALDDSVALTSFFRAMEHLEGEPESPEHSLAHWALSFTQMDDGDVAAARLSLEEARAIACRVGSPGAEAMAVQGLAHVAVLEEDRSKVLRLIDEAAALAMRPGVAPIHAGYVYCSVISICRALCDWGRATEWTHMSTRYCERESIAGYTGLCRYHQGEIDRLHGQLAQAEERVLRACEELRAVNRFSAGWGYSELVDIRVRRGDLDGAEEALAQAVALGDDGQPGRGRLLLARGDPQGAARSLTRGLAEEGFLARERRVFMLPLHVTACLAVGDEHSARASADELDVLAQRFGTPGPGAAAAVARGALALHRGDTATAEAELQKNIRTWCEVDAPYEGFFVAFSQPDDAVNCATAIQRALAQHRADHGFAPTVRVGLHGGEATARDHDYFGSAVTRAARISAAAGGGEVLVSADLVASCGREVPVVEERTLDLKGIAGPVPAMLVAWS